MPTVAVYRCSKCRTEYRPLDAGDRRFICCGVSLERVEQSGNRALPLHKSERPATASANVPASPQQSTELIEVIPPRDNTVDVLAVREMLNALWTGSPFSLEIAGDDTSRCLLVRGAPDGIAHIRRQLQATYDQVSFRTLSTEEDPGRQSNLPTACAKLTLARPAYLPVRTYENGDFQEADPIKGLLGAFDGMESGERALAQIILAPAPQQWSRRYEGSARQVEKNLSGEAMTMGLFLRQFVSVIAVMTAVAFGFWALLAYVNHAWITFFVAGTLFSFAVMGVLSLYVMINEQANVDPKLVQTKIVTPAYDASIRLFVVAKTQENANRKLREIVAAYRRLNLQSGNSFIGKFAEFDPRVLSLDRPSLWNELTAHVTRLSANELASMWHLPVGADVQLIRRTMWKRILPLPADVQEGILIGHSIHRGKNIPVHLSEETLWHHIFMIAKTQKGKSTLMAHLASEAMRQETAVVVIDPHGDLARSLLGLVPRARASDVVYIDFSDSHQVVGFNLLDMSQGRKADDIVANIVHVGGLIWSDNWGPRMEDALRTALRTLLAANEILSRRHQAQFTMLDIPPLFELPNFRHRLIEQYVADQKILDWWSGYFERLYESLRMDVINPVLTKIHRFSTHQAVRAIVGQPDSTVNFRELVNERRILLINTATGVIGPDAGGLLGAVLVDYINFAVREQMAIPDPSARARVVIVIDEFQAIPGVDYQALLAELQKMGASFILATQALGQLVPINRDLKSSILSNVATLFVFQTSAEDADLLRHELDDAVDMTDIINLDDYTSYVKTELSHKRLPVFHEETLPPRQGDPVVVSQIAAQMPRYTRSITVAESLQHAFQEEWYGRERNLLRQLMKQGRAPSQRTDKDKERREPVSDKQTASSPNSTPPTQDSAASRPASTESPAENSNDTADSSPTSTRLPQDSVANQPESSDSSPGDSNDSTDSSSKDKGKGGKRKGANP